MKNFKLKSLLKALEMPIAVASYAFVMGYTVDAFAQITGWERPITSKLEALQPGIIAIGVAIALIAFIIGIIKSIFGRGGFEAWKLPITAAFVGIAVALAPTVFSALTSVTS